MRSPGETSPLQAKRAPSMQNVPSGQMMRSCSTTKGFGRARSVGMRTICPPHSFAKSSRVVVWPQWGQVIPVKGLGMGASVVMKFKP